MQEYLFSSHEAQIQTLLNQAQTNHVDLLQLTSGFHSPMKTAALISASLLPFTEKMRNIVYIITCSLNAFLEEKWLISRILIKSRKVAPIAKKDKSESVKPVNYTLYNQKITFEFLKAHLWSAADILRGSLDPADYRQPVMTLLFLKRLNDTFEDNAEKLIKEGKSEKEAYGNKNRHYFFVPKDARWSVLSATSENIGEQIDHVCRIIERENPDLDGALTNTKYNDKRKYPDDKLRTLISHFNSPRLRNSDLEKEDIFGDAYEYLLEEFADQTKKRGGEFFTPREVVRLLVTLVEPKEGMSVYDPTCGSGGMLIESRKYVERTGGDPRNLVLEGQED